MGARVPKRFRRMKSLSVQGESIDGAVEAECDLLSELVKGTMDVQRTRRIKRSTFFFGRKSSFLISGEMIDVRLSLLSRALCSVSHGAASSSMCGQEEEEGEEEEEEEYPSFDSALVVCREESCCFRRRRRRRRRGEDQVR